MRSCGHRACNQCQHQSTQAWLERQEQKRLPVDYFMATFTLPKELRMIVLKNRSIAYDLLIRASAQTLKTFAQNDKNMDGELGFCIVLHTHTRSLDFHPHVHCVIPGGTINKNRRLWKRIRGKYLFNGRALAKVFRSIFLNLLTEAGLKPAITPKKWVVQCKRVGQGSEALQYLARYLYRGVISNANILADDGQQVTFRYRDSQSKQWIKRTLTGEKFIKLILQHCLPKGFRRARDYGFLHGNSKAILQVAQWILKVQGSTPPIKTTTCWSCPLCHSVMQFRGVFQSKAQPG